MGRKKSQECYVYRIFDRHETVYVGKGSGRRLAEQKRRFRLDGEVIERDLSDEDAFAAERRWIAELMPTLNVSPGGNGGRHRPRPQPRLMPEFKEIERVGSRRYTARFLLTHLNEHNCARYGVAVETLGRLREVASGPRI